MSTVETVFKITASVIGANAIKQLGNEIKNVSSAGDRLKGTLNAAATGLRAFATIQVARSVSLWTERNIDLADSLNDLRQRTGVSVQDLAKYKVAAENSGTSLDALAKGINKLNKNIVESRDGTGAAAKAFQALGISARELKTLDAHTAIKRISDAFSVLPDGPQKSAIAMTLLGGKIGTELIPMLNEGSENLDKLSLKIDQDFATAADNFNDKLGGMRAQFTQFGLDTARTLLPALDNAIESFKELFSQSDLARNFGIVTQEALNAVTIAIAGFVTAIRAAITTVKSLANLAGKMIVMGRPGVHTGTPFADFDKEFFGGLTEDFKPLSSVISRTANQSVLFGDGGAAYWKNMSQKSETNKPSDSLAKSFNSFNGGADKGAGAYERATRKAAEFIAKQREGIETLRQEAEYIGKTSIEIDKMKDARKFETEVAERAVGLKGKALEQFLKEAEAIKNTRQELLQLNYEKSRSFGAGVANFFTKFQEDAGNAAKNVQELLSNAFKGAEDVFVEFVTTGKANFKDLARSILADLARIAFRSTVSSLFSSIGNMFGGSFGNIFGSATPSAPMNILPKFARGGISDQPSIFGEAGPEAAVPLPDGRRIPVMLGGNLGSNQVNHVSVAVHLHGDQSSTKTQADSRESSQLGQLIAASVKSILINEKRPGGLLAA